MIVPNLLPGAIMAAAIAPALLLLWLVIVADSRPEPPRVVWVCVGLSALSAVPVGLLELWLQAHVPVSGNPWVAAYETATLFAGVPEEIVKVSIIAIVALRARNFDEPMDGVVYGTAVGLGFAGIENLLYLAAADTAWGTLAITRGVLSVPFHGALGAIAGAYIARARFGGALGAHRGRWRRTRMFVSAWLIPAILHSVFDGSLFSLRHISSAADSEARAGLAVLMLLIALVVGFGSIGFAIRLARRVAHHQKVWLPTRRLAPAHWRAVWARSVSGLGLSFVAVALLIAGDIGGRVAGFVLLVGAVTLSWHCARRLKEAARVTHRVTAA